MEQDHPAGGKPGPRHRFQLAAVAALMVGLALTAYWQIDRYFMGRALVMEDPQKIPSNPQLLAYANHVGASAFAENCASCHGADLKGSETKGVPNLTDNIWLYDYGRVEDIERTILYGIRSGNSKAHNVTDMPALGRQKAITVGDIRDVMAYMRSLKTKTGDPIVLARGERIFQDKGVCYDCHSREGTGVSDYGAPNLTDDDWIYGGDDKAVYKSIYDGRHGLCPAWISKLSFPAIRALAVYVHSMSKESPDVPKADAGIDPTPPSNQAG
jgi:cytochrome c oxidase cbb3-type subunit III